MVWKRNLGKLLKEERNEWGMSRRKLARLSYIDAETIEEIENGKIQNPDFYLMLRICEVLDTSVYFFIEREGEVNDWRIFGKFKRKQ